MLLCTTLVSDIFHYNILYTVSVLIVCICVCVYVSVHIFCFCVYVCMCIYDICVCYATMHPLISIAINIVLPFALLSLIFKWLPKVETFQCVLQNPNRALLSIHCRFSPLFHDDKLDICLEKDDPQLTLSVLILLSRLVRLPDVAALLCYHTNPCLLLTCYQLLVDPPPSNNSDVIFRIRLHVRMYEVVWEHKYVTRLIA